MLFRLLELFLLPIYLLIWCIDNLTGEDQWYRRQVQRMEDERAPLPDAEFLRAVDCRSGEEALWLAVRRAVAGSVGVSAEAVHPGDQLADLWRMQWMGPDLLDIVFRIERELGINVSRSALEPHRDGVHYGQAGEFHDFARGLVCGLSAVVQAEPHA